MSRRRSVTEPEARIARAMLAAALTLVASAQARALEVGSEVCAKAEAYDTKLGKAERKRREEEARQSVRTTLARRVWREAFAKHPELAASDDAFEPLRFRYRVLERLEGGSLRSEGDKYEKKVIYCLRRDRYLEIAEELRAERAETIEALRLRFSQLELEIADGELDVASGTLATLEIDVVGELLDLTTYESVTDGRTRPFYVWLFEWGDLVTRGPEYIRAMIARAAALLEDGRLEEADRYVAEALKADRDNAEARELRVSIQDRRNERVDLLGQAEELAATGRFRAARLTLDEARRIGSDDPLPLETTAGTVDALHAEYIQYNPPSSVLLFITGGTLGVDTGTIEDRVLAETEIVSEGSLPLSIGAGGNFRLGRFLLVGVSGSWGVSQDENRFVENEAIELYQVLQLTGGVGYRTRRREKRKFSIQATAGPVWESASVNTLVDSSLSSSDSQLAFFARLAVEWPSGSFFVQHGLGFEDSGGSLVGWSNNLQVGAAVVF